MSRYFGWGLFSLMATIYFVLISSGVKEFVFWSQVASLLDEEVLSLLFSLHPHSLRYLVVYPVVKVADLFSMDLSFVFSVYVLVAICLMSVVSYGIVRNMPRSYSERMLGCHESLPLFFLVYSVLSWFMNGRLVFGFLGVLVLVYAQIKWEHGEINGRKYVPMVIFSLLMMSISSGVFLVGYLSFFVYSFVCPVLRVFGRGGRLLSMRDGALILYWVLTVPLGGVFVYLYIEKNISYFGGGVSGIVNMLSHGVGGALFGGGGLGWMIVLFALVVVLFSALRIGWGLVRGKEVSFIFVPVVLSLCIGVFGYSTLALALPLLITLMFHWARVMGKGYVSQKWGFGHGYK